ncbi:HAD family hydrolase [Halalkalibacter okhensis]|uniref:Haloacid dehalogenase n=1 Tax=Halalkalibacter okhensis TaxID=333138 RepID=A0A0B0IH03_9BACI|nr:HAD family hydrolase [Halalkalibacter okhensis]KHF40167.1 haloacid dehalogenase [Halalkalibacter okhensis]
MAKVILFDLDGTLLPMDTHQFINHYIKELAPRVGHIVEPKKFVQALMAGTEAMIKNVEPAKTNEQVFEETFLAMTSLKRDEIWPTLDEFYDTVFPTFSHMTTPSKKAKEVVEEAVKQGFRVAIATNPVFPKVAIDHRLNWAGIDDLPFELVTVYEELSFTKPNVEYYLDICERLRVEPTDCIMIGNDVQEDMVTSTLGMNTFLVEGNVIDRGEPHYHIDDRGTLDDLYEKLANRQGIFK